MKYAVVKTGGKQYKVSEGDILEVDKLNNIGKTVSFDSVLLVVDNGKVEIGSPTVSGVSVNAAIIGDTKGKKIRVSKFKAKARYRRVTGYRHSFTQVKIETIGLPKQEVKTHKTSVKKTAKSK